jgi:hypothetical protein
VQVFAFYDADKSGLLSLKELKTMVRKEGKVAKEQFPDADIEKIYMLMATGGGGAIESGALVAKEDFLQFLQQRSPRFERVVQVGGAPAHPSASQSVRTGYL